MTYSNNKIDCYHVRGERGVTAKIKQAMQETAKQFVYIGFLLWEVKQYEYYYEEGYDNVYQYAEHELGFKRSSTKNFIAICENFCRKNEYKLPTMFLDEQWNDYQYSQLTEMLAMSPAQREQTKPTITVKQLREIKKPQIVEATLIAEPPKEKPATNGQTSGQQQLTLEEIHKEDQQLQEIYGIECHLTNVNGKTVLISHYVMQELCKLAGIKYIDWEDYKITIEMTDEDILGPGEKYMT